MALYSNTAFNVKKCIIGSVVSEFTLYIQCYKVQFFISNINVDEINIVI